MMRFFSRERRSGFPVWVRCVGLLAFSILAVWTEAALAEAGVADEDRVRERLGGVSIPFIANIGQSDPAVAYYAPTFAGTVFVTRKGEIVYSLPASGGSEAGVSVRSAKARGKKMSGGGWTLTERPVGGSYRPRAIGQQCAEARVNYFIGNDSARWRSGVPTYEAVGLGQAWPGVDLSLRVHGKDVEKLFTVRPGGDPFGIRMRLRGARSLRVNELGALVLKTGLGEVTFTAPVAYQVRDNIRRTVTVAYRLHGSEYGFSLGSYDPELPLVIDPLLQATYLGGSEGDVAYALAIHAVSGGVYVAGETRSSNFPGTAGGAQSVYGGGDADVFVARLNASLTGLTQATYLGGSDYDGASALAIHPSGEVYVAGSTNSTNFPSTAFGAQAVHGGGSSDVFIARLNASLTGLTQATYLGGSGSDGARDLAIHPSSGDVYVAGSTDSTDFPGTDGGAQPVVGGLNDAFVALLYSSLTGKTEATYLGGSGSDGARDLAIHPSSGDVYVAGSTDSTDFPLTAGGAQPVYGGGGSDAFVKRLNDNLTGSTQATYLGGSGSEHANALAVHPTSGDVYVAGYTRSTNSPGTAGGAQPASGGGFDAFVARLNASLAALPQATYLGGSGTDTARALAIHPTSGDVYVAGYTESSSFPRTAGGAQPASGGGFFDAFVARLTADLSVPNGDFNGDGRSDLVWRNAATGENEIWHMDGPVLMSRATFERVADTNWQIVGTGDFNRDGKPDLVWRNVVTGENEIWLMDGPVLVSGTTFERVADVNWRIVGTGDFSGDGKPDLVWRNAVTGENEIWNMDGPLLVSGTTFEQEADTNWRIVGTGDFSGDGKPDLVWRNAATGENEIWLMDGPVLVSGTAFEPMADTNWQIVAVGDYSGDGKPDLVWRNAVTGGNVVWFMDNGVHVSGATLGSVGDTSWRIVGPR